MPQQAEPWLRGPIPSLHTLLAPILYSFQQAREDLERHTEGLTHAQLWAKPHGFGSVAFHLRHIAGSTDRLMSYLQGRQLNPEQLEQLAAETQSASLSGEQLLATIARVFRDAETVVRALDPARLTEPRMVGRGQLPTTVAGLLTHIAEHTQRHVGQAISAAKLARREVSAGTVHHPQDLHTAFAGAMIADDLEGLAALYEDDATLLANGVALQGMAAIRRALAGYVAMKPHIELETASVLQGAGDLALLSGRWTLRGTAPDGRPIEGSGVSREVARRHADGTWRYVLDDPGSGKS